MADPAPQTDAAGSLEAQPRTLPADRAPVSHARKKPLRLRRVRWAVRCLALAIVLGGFMIGFDGCFYFPTREVYTTPDEFRVRYAPVWFNASDGVKLSGWFMPAEGPPRGTVIHFHGNAQNMSSHIAFVWWLPSRGFNLLTFDYRGYGASEGRVTRAGTIRDGLAAVDYALSRPDVDPRRLFIFGQSLGGAVATVVAAERPQVRAVVLDSTFSSYRRIAARHLQRSMLFETPSTLVASLGLSAAFEPIDYVGRIAPRPLLVIAGERDAICFPELGRELHDAAGEPKSFWLVPDAEHTGALDLAAEEAMRRITAWFDAAP